MLPDIHIIDCTFRDGGYYNNWNFPKEMIDNYLMILHKTDISIVELGFRFFNKNKFLGPCAFSTDSFLSNLKMPNGMRCAVMLNAADIVNHPQGTVEAIQGLFGEQSKSPVDIVRIAAHFYEAESLAPGIETLAGLGYTVSLNLMQIGLRTDAEIEKVAEFCSALPLDVLYFADSLGNLLPENVEHIVHILKRHWSRPIGIHTHDNMGRAVLNSLKAIECGVEWIDATVMGMGRGPGNARLEYLLLELNRQYGSNYAIAPLMELIRKYFGPLYKKFSWGPNPYYFLSGMYGIHPTYVQTMISDPRYSQEDILGVLHFLRNKGGEKYSQSSLSAARMFYTPPPKGRWRPIEHMEGKDVLVLATGPGAYEHRLGIEEFINKQQPVVIALNLESSIDESLIDYRAACHPVRLLIDADHYKSYPQHFITPYSMLPEEIKDKLIEVKYLDFGLLVEDGNFMFADTHCVAPAAIVAAYVLGIASSGKAKRILLAGFDGYGAGDPRDAEMNNIFACYMKNDSSLPITAITPTLYKIPQGSVYAPCIE